MPGCRALCQGTGGTRCTSPAAGKTQDPDLTCENKDEFIRPAGASHHGLTRLALVRLGPSVSMHLARATLLNELVCESESSSLVHSALLHPPLGTERALLRHPRPK